MHGSLSDVVAQNTANVRLVMTSMWSRGQEGGRGGGGGKSERGREGGSVRCSITLVSAVRSGRSGAEQRLCLAGSTVLQPSQNNSPGPSDAFRDRSPHPAEKTETFYSLTYFLPPTPSSTKAESDAIDKYETGDGDHHRLRGRH